MTKEQFKEWYNQANYPDIEATCEEALVFYPSVLEAVKLERDQVYEERNALVRFLATLYPSGIRKSEIEACKMSKSETRILTEDEARIVRDNFRWFAGFKCRIKKLGEDRYAVTSWRWCWSHIDLS